MNLRHAKSAAGATAIASFEEKLPPQILVVDDSPEVREFVALLLRLSGYRVLKARDGNSARDILKTEHPDLVISDLEMPGGDGWDVLAYCHAQRPSLPVLIVSSATFGRRPDVESWAAGYLPKPLNLIHFHEEIQRLLSPVAWPAAQI